MKKMEIKEIKKFTPYQDINDLLAGWTESVKNILGENAIDETVVCVNKNFK